MPSTEACLGPLRFKKVNHFALECVGTWLLLSPGWSRLDFQRQGTGPVPPKSCPAEHGTKKRTMSAPPSHFPAPWLRPGLHLIQKQLQDNGI